MECPDCGGDGKETCNNPDHGFMRDFGDAHGCPCCGNDPEHKIPNGGNCERCCGIGEIDNTEQE